MLLATSAQVKQLDQIASAEFSIPEEKLMENAASALAEEIFKDFGRERSFLFLCGRGKNGGDGLLTAKNLLQKGCNVSVFATDPPEQFNPLTLRAYETAKSAGVPIHSEQIAPDKSTVVVDALLGIGITGEPKGSIKETIDKVQEWKNIVISIDIPSGVNADNGRAVGSHIKAKKTYSLAIDKVGLNVYPGAELAGEKIVLDIGIPKEAYTRLNYSYRLISDEMARMLLPKRADFSHKGTFGKVGIVGGSLGMSGSVTLASLAALRAGAGMCYLFVPDDIYEAVCIKLNEVIVRKDSELEKYMGELDAIAIGMGHAQNPKAKHIMKLVMQKFTKPVLVDGDGLNFLAVNEAMLKKAACPLIFTPHEMEFSRLSKMDLPEVIQNKIYFSMKYAKENCVTTVLKGPKTIVASQSGEVRINTTGNNGMATAGSGDVLSGIIAGLLAQGLSPYDAASLGVYLHGASGDIYVKENSKYSLIAGDLIVCLPKAFHLIEQTQEIDAFTF